MRRRREKNVNVKLGLAEAETFVARAKILLRLLDLADEAAAAQSLGEYAIMLDALGRYHALRCEHAEHIDIRLSDD